VYEFSSAEDAGFALRAMRASASGMGVFDVDTGELAVEVGAGEQRAFSAVVQSLVQRNRVRLSAKPSVTVLSGAEGNLFVGQRRFINVLSQRNALQEAQILELAVGYALKVRPIVGAGGEITLQVSPRVSTVDALEIGSGLPTLGIREVSATVRVSPGEALLIAGLDSSLHSKNRNTILQVPGGRRTTELQTTLVVLVTARQV
jgi:type II secretory pathway component GspD/PulD (secretin)